mmetsp:Transcript_129572/g.192874  ORF Transcript_129572/g.192874 Transcript_129572/m.192874 type:complete len:103 (-) Transcript_129572:59-367(-)
MPQLEQNMAYQYQQSKPNESVVTAWASAVRETVLFVKPIFGGNFFPISLGILVGVTHWKEFNHNFLPYFLVCGSVAAIAKFMPSVVCPAIASYVVLKRICPK